MELVKQHMVNCNPYQDSYSYECSLQDCFNAGDLDCSCPPGFERDCNCNCRIEGANSYAYLTDCGCRTNGGVCPSDCVSNGLGQTFIGPGGSIDANHYCYDSYIECPSLSGCTNENASNYNPNATIDDGSCQYDEVQSIMYKPSVEKMWLFKTISDEMDDLTGGNQIDNFNNVIYDGVYGVSNIYYLRLYIGNDLITNTNSMIFAFVNNQLRGFANVNSDGYCFLEVKWMQELENEQIITFFIKHNDEIRLIDEIRTFENQLINNAYTTDSIYEIDDDLPIINFD